MFDAKRLLDMVVQGAAQPRSGGEPGAPPAAQGGGGIEDLLRHIQLPASRGSSAPGATSAPSGIEDIFRNLTGGAGAGSGSAAGSGGVSDILGKLQQATGVQGGGGLADTLRQVLSQATQGTQEGAGKIGQATGLRDLVGQLSGGRSPDELLAQLKTLMANNQLATGAALGGLGTLVLGTRTGRSVAVNAAKLGALALVGGLAYKAYQNYQKGQAAPDVIAPAELAPPSGSGFEPAAISNDSAALYIRAMIAAAAADGRIDDVERQRILGGVQQAGIETDAQQFLERELRTPASIEQLAAQVSSQEDAMRVFTAARLAIEPDTEEERAFLDRLANGLKLDPALAGQIDQTARAAAAA